MTGRERKDVSVPQACTTLPGLAQVGPPVIDSAIMTDAAAKLLEAVMKLPKEEREALAWQVLEPVNDVAPDIEEAWKSEVARRRQAVLSGEAKLYSWDEVDAAMRASNRGE